MELLLNLAWLLLALPAYWIWRASKSIHMRRRFTPLQGLLALGCMLVVLFPVISATDDLHAMRAEMEESPTGKRSFSQKSGDRPSSWAQGQPALIPVSSFFIAGDQTGLALPILSFSVPTARLIPRPGRAPPQSSLC